MAEYYFRRIVECDGLGSQIETASAGTSEKEVGQPVYLLAKRQMASKGIGCKDKVSQQMTMAMYDSYDMIVAMDSKDLVALKKIIKNAPENKVTRLLDHVPGDNKEYSGRDIAAPLHTRKFDTAWQDIRVGCDALLQELKKSLQDEDPAPGK